MKQRIGYECVATDGPHLDLQRDALQRARCQVIYDEAASGKNVARLELEQCRKPRLGERLVREIKAVLRDPDIQVVEIVRRHGVSRATVYKQ